MCIFMEKEHRLIGYVRVSTEDQELRLQRQALEKYGVKPEHIYEEKASGSTMNRPVWKRITGFMRPGDTVVVWRLDRLGRTMKGLLDTVEKMSEDGVKFVSVTENLDTVSPGGTLIFHVFSAVTEFERRVNSERTKAGIAAKRKELGKEWGRRSPIDTSPIRLECMYQYLTIPDARRVTANQLLRWINALPDPKAKKIKSAETLRRWVRLNRTSDDGDEELFHANHPSLCD